MKESDNNSSYFDENESQRNSVIGDRSNRESVVDLNKSNFTEVDRDFGENDRDSVVQTILVKYNADDDAKEVIPLNHDVAFLPFVQIQAVADNYPEFKERIEELYGKALNYSAVAVTLKDNIKEMSPNNIKLTSSTKNPDVIKEWAGLHADLELLLNEIAEEYPASSETPSAILLDTIRKSQQILLDPNYRKYQALDPNFEKYIRSNFLTIPYNSFKTDGVDNEGNPVFEMDDERYKALSEKLPFVDMAVERIEFMQKKMIQFQFIKERNSYGQKDYMNYVDDYKNHLLKQAEYADAIKKLTVDDKDIKDNRVFHKEVNTLFGMNWKESRFGNPLKEDVVQQFAILDRGWSVEDIPVIIGLQDSYQKAKDIVENDNAEITKEMKKEASKLLAVLEDPMERVSKAYIASPEARLDILKELKQPMEKYAEIVKPIRSGVVDPIVNLLDSAIKRNVKPFEVGRVPATIKEVKDEADSMGAFDYDDISTNIDYMVEDLKAVELRYKGSNQFKNMKEYLLDLQKYSDHLMKNGAADENELTPTEYRCNRMLELRIKLENVLQANEAYLEHKKRDFTRDNTRRDSEGKQKTEQPRIRMSLKMRDTLLMMIDRVNQYEQHVYPEKKYVAEAETHMEEARDRLWNRIQEVSKKIDDDKNNTMSEGDYRLSLARMMYYYHRTSSSYLKKRDNESDIDYKNRLEGTGAKEVSPEHVKNDLKSITPFVKVINAEVDKYVKYKNGQSDEPYKKVNMETIKNLYKQAVKDVKVNAVKEAEQKKSVDSRRAQSSTYRDELVAKPKNKNKGAKKAPTM